MIVVVTNKLGIIGSIFLVKNWVDDRKKSKE